jgi:thiamine kinase-like enzyme
MATGFIHNWLGRLGRVLGVGALPAQRTSSAEKRKVYRVGEPGKPRFQLRQGEEGLSVFDARHVQPEDVLPAFRPGSLVVALEVEWLESFGLQVAKTPGEPRLPKLLQDNHAVICPGTGMTRKQFKQTLKALEDAWRVGS